MSIEHDLKQLVKLAQSIDASLKKIVTCVCIEPGKAEDLSIVLESQPPSSSKGKVDMAANKKASGPDLKCPCLAAKGGPKKAVMPDVTITDPAPKSIALQAIDASGAVVVLTPADSVTGTLTSDSPNFVVAPGADTLTYTGTIPAGTPFGTVANLAATLVGTIQGSPANFTASVKLTINIPPSPVAVDLIITIG